MGHVLIKKCRNGGKDINLKLDELFKRPHITNVVISKTKAIVANKNPRLKIILQKKIQEIDNNNFVGSITFRKMFRVSQIDTKNGLGDNRK